MELVPVALAERPLPRVLLDRLEPRAARSPAHARSLARLSPAAGRLRARPPARRDPAREQRPPRPDGERRELPPERGRQGYVAFESEASDLVAGDHNDAIDTFVYDWSTGRVRAATRPGSEPGPVGSRGAAISREGRYVGFYTPERYDAADADAFGDACTVVFCTGADRLQPPGALGDTVFVWRCGGGEPVSLANAGVCTDGATVSADGRTALFSANMPGLVPADTSDPRQSDVFAAEPLG
jgi:hypothetical protein